VVFAGASRPERKPILNETVHRLTKFYETTGNPDHAVTQKGVLP